MKWIVAAALLALTAQAAAAPLSRPQRIMSLRICTDELLLDLVDPSRIASVTFMSQEPAALRRWPQGAKVAVNYGSAEEIVAARPDLILTDPFMAPALRQLLTRTGAKLLDVPPAENFDQIRAVTRLVARAVGEAAKGEALIAQMDADLKVVAARRPARMIRVAEWGNGGYVPGANGLFGAMLTAAGATSIETGAMGYYDVEALLAANPEKLVYGDTYRGMASLRADQDNHPALMKRYRDRSVRYASLYGCGVPQSGRVTRELQAALLGIKP
jgi:iron complex transport system substrate-binding protein